ncbi:MAG: 1-acyl-sn-glycerol-3-phosphate acyltransferase [Alphaproteobacteria bacterium]|nr:1-acyl-sn-glycerol-3-phosphate acyltransferase [Alphaproteobacteria bacterium]
MPRSYIRSILFNLLFVLLTGIACIVFIPMLFMPRRAYMGVVHIFVHMEWFLERTVLNLKTELRGLENLPANGPYIIAAKHQSAYETMKLHIFFKDPAVILKKELFSIPLWGLYLKKSDPIAIDRSTPKTAIKSIQDGARRIKEQGRPIVIFPQGTRVSPETTTQEKPYKIGVIRLQEATDLPIIPVALNAGLFWPKNSFWKSEGTVTMKFLPAIQPGGQPQEILNQLEKTIESESLSLMNEAREKYADKKGSAMPLLAGLSFICAAIFAVYSYAWFEVAKRTKEEYRILTQNIVPQGQPVQTPKVTGYPGKIKMDVANELLQTKEGSITITNLHAEGWPIPYLPIKVKTGPITIKHFRWPQALSFDSMDGIFTPENKTLIIQNANLKKADFLMNVEGTLDFSQEEFPEPDLRIHIVNYNVLMGELLQNKIIDTQSALFLGGGLNALSDENGDVFIPVHQKDRTILAGPLPIYRLKPKYEFDRGLGARLRPIP